MPEPVISLGGLSIERLRSFCQIVEAGSAAAAAKRNSILPGQLSRQIKDLEASLGTKLFSKEGKHLKLTAGGMRLAALTNAYFAGLQELKEEEGNESRPMVLGAGDSVVRWLLVPRLVEVLVAAGGFVDIGTYRTGAIIDRLESGQLDVGLIRSDAESDGLERLTFPTLRYVLMVPRSFLPDKSAAGIKNIRLLPFIMLTGDGRFVRSVELVAKTNGIALQARARVESFGLAVEAAKVLNDDPAPKAIPKLLGLLKSNNARLQSFAALTLGKLRTKAACPGHRSKPLRLPPRASAVSTCP